MLVERIVVHGWSVPRASAAIGVSMRTGHKWLRRYRAGGAGALVDGACGPHRRPRRTAARLEGVQPITSLLSKARDVTSDAQASCADGKSGPARQRLGQAAKRVRSTQREITSKKGRRTIPQPIANALVNETIPLLADL